MIDTLYITDLDGTLLQKDKSISAYSAAILNKLIDGGAAITVASARSLVGIRMVNLADVPFRIPMVLMNGVLLYDYAADRILDSCVWDGKTASAVLRVCAEGGKTPFLYCVADGKMDITYTELTSEGERLFLKDRVSVFPETFHKAGTYSVEGAVYCSMQDRYEVLSPIYRRLLTLPGVNGVLYKDTYREGNWYLEVFSGQGGKNNGVNRLRDRLGARKVVAFGDNLNDLPLLEAADIACAVANAAPAVREAADILIGSNEEDGVARFIWEDFCQGKELNL